MEKFWHTLYDGWGKMSLPFLFIYLLVNRFLWDMYWYKYIVPKRWGRAYKGTSFKARIKDAWYYTRNPEI